MNRITVCLYFLAVTIFNSCSPSSPAQKLGKDWYRFAPDNDFRSPSPMAMQDWLDAPAGKHGFLQIDGKDLVFEDGTPVRFWGVNICSRKPFVPSDEVHDMVAMLTFMGINGVRFHKFSNHGTVADYSTVPDSALFARMDYFQYQLREAGIYYGWSHIYGLDVKPGDSSRLLAYDEIINLQYPWAHLNGSTSSLVNFAPDLQDLSIELTVNMLNRVNPHTGLRYADDPALAFVEFQNEDDIFWGAIEKSLEQAPTYRALLCKQFSEWLGKKYENNADLRRAWGSALPENESIAGRNIYPGPNHHVFSQAYQAYLQGQPMPRHLIDKLHFLYETQLDFYRRFEEAVRATGYRGVLVSSCWQAGSGFSHFYNLHADYEIGMIDRHNYFGGGQGGHRMDTGFVRSAAMVSRPGSGLLSTGMQQVLDRPFALSEWMSLIPNPWTAEASPIIAAYGMGLQGWDASFAFAVDGSEYTPRIDSDHGVYNVTSPTQMGLYPTLARMIYRGDIAEGPVLAKRRVSLQAMTEGKLGLEETVRQDYDTKFITGSIPSEALAKGRVPIVFTPDFVKNPPISPNQLTADAEKVITSETGQLEWDFSERGFIRINTAGTKGVVGFVKGHSFDLASWRIEVDNDFAVVLMTSLEHNKDLATSNRILITTVGRAHNTGMVYSDDDHRLLNTGKAPILLEPIRVTLKPGRTGQPLVMALDHMGRPTDKTLDWEAGGTTLDGERYQTMYYLLEY